MTIIKRIKKIALLLVAICVLCLCIPISLQFEFVYKIPIDYNEETRKSLPWFTIVNDRYDPMFDLNSLENYGVDINNVKYKFDLENYSYIVCYGHELERLTYRYIKPIKRKGLIPDALTGKATMSSKNQDNIYIYRIRRKNVVCYFHDMDICTKYK